MKPEIAISLKNICNRFGEQVVHKNLNLDVRKGEVLGLIGGSGSGKSVLLHTITGINKQFSGEIEVMGVNLTRGGSREWEEARKNWGVLFQDGALFSSLTVMENVQVPLRQFARLSPKSLGEVGGLKISMAGLPPEAAYKLPSELSGGMRKRAGLARALALDPAILLLDEPTAGLDPLGATAFDQLLHTLSKSLGLTVLLVTHDLDTLYAVCDRVAVLAEKRIYAIGSIDELKAIEHPWIQEYFNGPRGRAAAQATENKRPAAAEPQKQAANEVKSGN